jgi:ribosomal protein S18 acetylase RimI-like enzyme
MTDMNTNDSKKKEKRHPITIRRMTIDDIAPVFHLGEKLFTLEISPNLYRTWDEYEVITNFQGDAEFCLAAEAEDEIVGFLMGTIIAKRHSSWRYGYLIWLGVAPPYQTGGIASRLFHHFRNLMIKNGVRMLLVDTEADNLAALKFFEKMGFEKPKRHIYLTLNLDNERSLSKDKEKKKNHHEPNNRKDREL